jgi:membrane protein insertase Oxa1/YidC/SpoIIIJ
MYRYLDGLKALKGVAFMGIDSLSRADALLYDINVLPVLMTVINLASVLVYGRARRWQGIALAFIFLALLYQSPAGLVLYWTSSSLFSLLRNVVSRLVVPRLPNAVRDFASRFAMQA